MADIADIIDIADITDIADIADIADIVSNSVNQGMSTARRMHASLYNWIVYKQRSKAKEKEKGGQAVLLEILYDFAVT